MRHIRCERWLTLILFAASLAPLSTAQQAAGDKLGRDTPQSGVTNFIEACRRQDYDLATQFLDLRSFSEQNRREQGPELARKLEAALNAAAHFNLLALSRNPEGDPSSPNPSREQIATLVQNGKTYSLDLERVALQPGSPPVWLFSADTVLSAAGLSISTTGPWLIHYLPPFFVSVQFLETPLWEWTALLIAAFLLLSLSRLLDRILVPVFRAAGRRLMPQAQWAWTEAVVRPIRVLLSVFVFRLWLGLIQPSLIARLYIGRTLEVIVVGSIAWALVQIVDLFLERVESDLAARQQVSGRSIIRLGRRTASFTIVVLAVLMILSSWGYNTGTLIAGLGVGGIAVALAAQQTIANIFGGISVIGDHPVTIGDFGTFGDVVGTVEDIGMRSTRVRTLNRSLVSIPNSTFAGANLENYSQRDKILFNPTLQIKRSTPDDQVVKLIELLRDTLQKHQSIQLVPAAVRLTGLTAAAYNIEIFCYVLTAEMDQFYKIQGELLLALNLAIQNAHIELA